MDIIAQLEALTPTQTLDLVKKLEEKWGVSAQSPVAVKTETTPAPAVVEKQTSFGVTLRDFGKQKIAVIKAVREFTKLGLVEAKALVERAPILIMDGSTEAEAREIIAKLEAAGASAEIR